MNVTLLTDDFPPTIGGGETIVYLLSKYLSKRNIKVSVVAGQSIQTRHDKSSSRVKIIRHPDFQRFSYGEVGLKYILDDIYGYIESTKPDLIHAFNLLPGYVGSFYSRINHIPLVLTYFHTPKCQKMQIRMSKNQSVDDLVTRDIIKSTDYDIFTTIGHYYAKSAVKVGILKEKARWCYPGPDLEIFKPSSKSLDLRRSLKVDDKELFIVVPVRISPRKRIETIIEAVDLIKDKIPVKVLISGGAVVGKGYEKYHRDIINFISKKSLQKQIIIPQNRFKFEELGRVYSSADLGVMASEEEGLGLGIIEMMSCAVPVVVSLNQGTSEIITPDKDGYFFTVGNSPQLAKQIMKLAKDQRLRMKLGQEGKQSVDKKFNLMKYIDFHEKIYQEFI